jgi:hypothetical protein
LTSAVHGIVACLAALFAGISPATAAEPHAETAANAGRAVSVVRPNSSTGFAAFRSIGDWNIFDPNRVGRKTTESPSPAGDTISLVGTMQYAKGLFAFFDSYRKALHVGDAIAGFTLTRINGAGVMLMRDSKPVPLAVGQQLSRPEGGQWRVSTAARVEQAPAASAEPAIPAGASDILKRMMERRQKQLSQ